MDYLLDTNWIIHVLAGQKETATYHKNLNLGRVAVSYITLGEIYEVAFNYANPHAHLVSFRQFLAPFKLLNVNDLIMERFGEIRSFLRRRGEIISDFDILIAATALHYDLTLLTYNARHFKRIPHLRLYPQP